MMMKAGKIHGWTRDMGAPRDWDHERDGPCGSLPVRDERHGAMPAMVSAWFPTAEQLERLAAGAPVYLTIVGYTHPPVALTVGAVDHEDERLP